MWLCKYTERRKRMARKKILVPINPMEQKINDKQKIEKIFATLSQESKLMVMVYVSALRDKEIANGDT